MATPMFLLQIVESRAPQHALVRFPGGGPLEAEFIGRCTEAIVRRGVGFLRSEAHVRQAIADGITEAVLTLKQESRKVVV